MIQQMQMKNSYLPNDNPLQSSDIRDKRRKSYYTATEFREVTKTDLTRLFKKHGRIS